MQVSISFVSRPRTSIQGLYSSTGAANNKTQPSDAREVALTNASVVLLSFPMVQPAAGGPQLPRPTASHIIWLKDTNAEAPSTHGYSQTNSERPQALWSLSSPTLVLHRIRGFWYEVEQAGRDKCVCCFRD